MFDEDHAGERMEREDGRPRQAVRGGGVGLPEAGQLAPAIVRQVVGPAGLLEKFQYPGAKKGSERCRGPPEGAHLRAPASASEPSRAPVSTLVDFPCSGIV